MALPPLELFSLEREGRLLPGGLFVASSNQHSANSIDQEILRCTVILRRVFRPEPAEGISGCAELALHCRGFPPTVLLRKATPKNGRSKLNTEILRPPRRTSG